MIYENDAGSSNEAEKSHSAHRIGRQLGQARHTSGGFSNRHPCPKRLLDPSEEKRQAGACVNKIPDENRDRPAKTPRPRGNLGIPRSTFLLLTNQSIPISCIWIQWFAFFL